MKQITEEQKLLMGLLEYMESQQKYRHRRCGRYIEGIQDCLITLQKGDFEEIKVRDRKYCEGLKLKLKVKR